ncbi:unnamed protein product [Dicrocoelium dendriticum]|nr:unnamed protein product [Dicrocoelium dendriticum]
MPSNQSERSPESISTFRALGVNEYLCTRLNLLDWIHPTPVQCAAVQPALQGKDIVGVAETGSGKTGAFLLPVIQRWMDAGRPHGFGLLLAPTRELAHQLANEATRLGACGADSEDHLRVVRLVGGEDMVEQALQLAWHKHHLLVATPGRFVDHMRNSPNFAHQQLSQIRQLVLDEADQMLNMAFADDIDLVLDLFQQPHKRKRRRKKDVRLLEQVAKANSASDGLKSHSITNKKFPHPQTHLYSATMTKDVAKLRRAALSSDAVFVCVNSQPPIGSQPSVVSAARIGAQGQREHQIQKTTFPPGLVQYCLPVRLADKPAILDWLLQEATYVNVKLCDASHLKYPSRALVFCKRRQETRLISRFLHECGHSVGSLSGRMKEAERKQSLLNFVSGHCRILVATDVASRGLDIPYVDLVVNYSVPPSEKLYRHRVGRTARAGRSGVAVTLITRDSAPTFLELEAQLASYHCDSVRASSDCFIPRWPIPLPGPTGRHGMLLRRRLAGEAWARAGKAIRMQDDERRRLAKETMDDEDFMLSSDSDPSGALVDSGASDEDDLTDVVEDVSSTMVSEGIPTQNSIEPLNTSGTHGLAAARLSWKLQNREKRNKRKQRLEHMEKLKTPSIGWGIVSGGQELADDIEDVDHLRIDEQLKNKYHGISTKKSRIKNH